MSSPQSLNREAIYLQIFGVLAGRISKGVWKPGGALPNEVDLAREFNVSVGTIRKTLDKLEADRVIERLHGRGSFVLDHTSGERAFRFSKIVDDDGNRIDDLHSVLLSQEIGTATAIERARLDLTKDDQVVRTRRVRSHEGRFCRHEFMSLARERLGVRSIDEVGDYLITSLAQKCGVHLARADEKITAACAPSDIAELLGTKPDKTLLQLDRVIYALDARPVEWCVSLCDLKNAYYLAEMQ